MEAQGLKSPLMGDVDAAIINETNQALTGMVTDLTDINAMIHQANDMANAQQVHPLTTVRLMLCQGRFK